MEFNFQIKKVVHPPEHRVTLGFNDWLFAQMDTQETTEKLQNGTETYEIQEKEEEEEKGLKQTLERFRSLFHRGFFFSLFMLLLLACCQKLIYASCDLPLGAYSFSSSAVDAAWYAAFWTLKDLSFMSRQKRLSLAALLSVLAQAGKSAIFCLVLVSFWKVGWEQLSVEDLGKDPAWYGLLFSTLSLSKSTFVQTRNRLTHAVKFVGEYSLWYYVTYQFDCVSYDLYVYFVDYLRQGCLVLGVPSCGGLIEFIQDGAYYQLLYPLLLCMQDKVLLFCHAVYDLLPSRLRPAVVAG